VFLFLSKEHFIRNDGSRDYRKAENAGQLDDNCFLTFFEDTGDDHFGKTFFLGKLRTVLLE